MMARIQRPGPMTVSVNVQVLLSFLIMCIESPRFSQLHHSGGVNTGYGKDARTLYF